MTMFVLQRQFAEMCHCMSHLSLDQHGLAPPHPGADFHPVTEVIESRQHVLSTSTPQPLVQYVQSAQHGTHGDRSFFRLQLREPGTLSTHHGRYHRHKLKLKFYMAI